MPRNVFQEQKTNERVKCVKCRDRDATREDQMCDNCRFMLTIEGMLKNTR